MKKLKVLSVYLFVSDLTVCLLMTLLYWASDLPNITLIFMYDHISWIYPKSFSLVFGS